jgi:hypothetical protein
VPVVPVEPADVVPDEVPEVELDVPEAPAVVVPPVDEVPLDPPVELAATVDVVPPEEVPLELEDVDDP